MRKLIGNNSRIGLGGEGILRTNGRDKEAQKVIETAFENGIRYFDSAPAYAGSEQYLGHFWKKFPARRDETFQASKSAERDVNEASAGLLETLSRLGREHLGLWQIHDLRYMDDIRQLEGKQGALRAFYQARETGLIGGIGVTGHHDPDILLHAVMDWDIDSVLLPVNPVEAVIGGFIDRVIPAAREIGVGVIGMKVLGAGNYLSLKGFSPEALIRFALSQDLDLAIVGCSTPTEAQLLARVGMEPPRMTEEDQEALVEIVRPFAERLAFYRGVI